MTGVVRSRGARRSPQWRRATALATCITFSSATFLPCVAWANPTNESSPAAHAREVDVTPDERVAEPAGNAAVTAPQPEKERTAGVSSHAPPVGGAASTRTDPTAGHPVRDQGDTVAAELAGAAPPAAPAPSVQSLAVGGDKTGVSGQAISLPQGTAKVQGMGESFSTDLSTGVASLTVPLSLPAARGSAQPSLSLHYSSGSGHGIAGVGWEIGVPFIARQTDRGLPQYADPAKGGGWTANQDRFVFNGGQELVPICLVSGTTCSGAVSGEAMPTWADGSQYFRPRVEGSYLRFFWMPDHRTWRVQSKSGETMELGVPLDGSGDTSALETDPEAPSHVFRWNLVRQYDSYGGANPADAATKPLPVNVVVYRYLADGAMTYVSDIYDTPPTTNTTTAGVSTYAHHTHLAYEARPDATFSYRRGWKVTQGLRLTGIDVTSATFGATGTRELVRRYHLAYDPGYHVSLLTSVQMEGKCGDSPPVKGSAANPVEDGTGLLPATTGCARLPALTFGYQHVTPYNVDGSPGTADLTGYEGFDERVTNMTQSPPNSVDEQMTDLFDINSDALPDVVVTMPGSDSKFPMYLNGQGGANAFGAARLGLVGVLGATSTGINLANDNMAALDIDGDGTIDWVHQPQVRQYAVYTPQLLAAGWFMVGRTVPTSAQQSPQLDLGEDTPDIDVLDANGDGLVDVVRATGTEMQTFFSLDRYPGGDGNFGSARWTGATTANLSLTYVQSCVPLVSPGVPVRFSDSTIHLGDMNGDGLQDIVYVQQGDVRYWPGRGDGSWGTGALGSCSSGFASNTYVAMNDGPQYSDPSGSGLRLDDVNGDGLDDLVQIRFDAIDVWLNVDGVGFTPQRHVIQNVTPASGPLWQSKVRLVDINGSGTRDVLWGEGGNYRYMDLSGGQRPWVLTHVANGLGKTTDLTYASSTQLMLADAAAGQPWTSVAPMPIHVVTKSTEKDNLGVVGMPSGTYATQFSYRDAVYDGRQREFRGFRTATSRKVGDVNSPSSTSTSTFLLGECKNDEGLAIDPCTPQGRWEDNPREALKGLPLTVETSDDSGDYLSTVHHTYRLRRLYTGLDGREVRVAFQSSSDTYQYDDGPFVPATTRLTASLTDVELETTAGSVSTDTSSGLSLRSAGNVHITTSSVLDFFGNTTDAIDSGATGDEPITKHTTPGRSSCDASGWMWRTMESYTYGSCSTHRDDTLTQYNCQGSPVQTQAVLSGTLPLVRPSMGAPTPPLASSDRTILVSTLQYDTFGVLVFASSANGRCRSITPDATFDELPVMESVYVGAASTSGAHPGCGTNALNTVAQYDRGLGVVTQVTGLHGELTTASFDNFGRILTLSKPDPATSGATSSVASLQFEYVVPADPTSTPFSYVLTSLQVGSDARTASYRTLVTVTDGLGRTIVTAEQADPSVGDAGNWIVDKLTEFDGKGAVERIYEPTFFSGTLPLPPLSPSTTFSHQRYDAFGRVVETYALDGTLTLRSVHHALSSDHWDAADLEVGGAHYGTFATEVHDGHGRTVSAVERIHVGNGVESRETQTTYLPTGEPVQIKRVRDGTSSSVSRWIQYDTLGRMVLNVEPDTSTGFISYPAACGAYTPPSSLNAWRYAYDDNGDLVGTSDARGCGANYLYDAGGRIVAEDFSPCLSTQQAYSSPNLITGDGTEAFYQYDSLPSNVPASPAVNPATLPGAPNNNEVGCTVNTGFLNGRLVAVSDRGAHTVTSYDGRGRPACVERQIASPAGPSNTLSARYAPHWYTQATTYDGADRPVTASTGADVAGLMVAVPNSSPQQYTSAVTTHYSQGRGTVQSVTSDYGTLVGSVTRDADNLVSKIVYGDVARTTSAFTYDLRRRLSSTQTYRGPPAIWSNPLAYLPFPTPSATPPTSFQLLLEDTDIQYDVVDNPVAITDWRSPSEWPAGAQPVSRKIQYDDLYRAISVGYAYTGGSDPWTSPFSAEDLGVAPDPRLAVPSPHVSFANRVESQSFEYDWLGNTAVTDDDSHGFYDRSLGTITNGSASAGPYRIASATGTSTGTRGGSLTTAYDAAGNLTGLAVDRSGPCLPVFASCHQRFAYDWDEVGRLVQARRWDMLLSAGSASSAVPATPANVTLQYTYDASDGRVLKTAVDVLGNKLYTAYIFGSLELRRATAAGANDYTRSTATEVPYLQSHGVRLARVHYAEEIIPAPVGQSLHVFLETADHLGSTSTVVDLASSEVVERGTYMAYGQAESDYRPTRWGSFREDNRFTGKEEDVEVGLQYFGKRFYAPALNRWVSADPLAVHGLKADLNAYAYVSGQLLKAVDLEGLELTKFQQFLDSIANPKGPVAKGVTDALAERGEALVTGVKTAATAIAHGDATPVVELAKGFVTAPITSTISAGEHAIALGEALAAGDTVAAAKHATNMVLDVADAVSAGAGVAGAAKGGAARVSALAKRGIPLPVPGLGAGGIGIVTVKVGGGAERAAAGAAETASKVAKVRPDLPPFDGETTHGVLVTNDGKSIPLKSGNPDPAYKNYVAAGHVEGKAAIAVREGGSTGGTVYHNNPNGTCGYCDRQLSTLLPEGAQLEVVPPSNAVANNSRAVDVPKTYTGNSAVPKTQ